MLVVMRGIYKDLLLMITDERLLTRAELRTKACLHLLATRLIYFTLETNQNHHIFQLRP